MNWEYTLPKVAANTVPNAWFAGSYNLFIDSADNITKKKDSLGNVTEFQMGGLQILSATTDSTAFLHLTALHGKNIEAVSLDGVILEDSEYSFSNTTDNLTWTAGAPGTGKQVKIWYENV